MSQQRRRLAAIMYTDMVGYTALGQRNEELSLSVVKAQTNVLDPVLARHNGRKVKSMGDAFLIEFTNALEAVRCAYDIQRSVKEYNLALPNDERLRLRVGIHLGDVMESHGDILGDAVNVASRVEPLAEDGGVCMTQQVYDHVHNKLDVPLVSLGRRSLKNVSEQIEIYKMVMPWEEEKDPRTKQLDKKRIAVLPFSNMSPDPADEYFADGLTEELIAKLSLVKGLRVIARTSIMNYKKQEKRISEIGSELGVGYMVESSVRKADNKIRITAQLIDARSEEHLWSERYDRELDDIFGIQDDIAEKIADALQMKLASAHEPSKKTENIEAYTLYLRGRSLWNTRSRKGVMESIESFLEAIKIDPEYAKAWSGLADAYFIAANHDYVDREHGLAKAREAAQKALELDDSLAEAHTSLAEMLRNDLKFEEARKEFERAIQLNPNYATAHHWYANLLSDLGRLRDSLDEIRRARQLDPLSPIIRLVVGIRLDNLGQIDEAIAIYDDLIKTQPDYSLAYAWRCGAFTKKNLKERAFADLEAWHNLLRDENYHRIVLAWFYAWFGEREKAEQLMLEQLKNEEKSRLHAYFIAIYYAILGETDKFFAWIDTAIATKDIELDTLRYSSFCDRVRNDARFPEIFEKLGLTY